MMWKTASLKKWDFGSLRKTRSLNILSNLGKAQKEQSVKDLVYFYKI